MPSGSHGHRWESRPGLTGVVGLERRSNERTCCQGMVGDLAEAEKEARRMPWGAWQVGSCWMQDPGQEAG